MAERPRSSADDFLAEPDTLSRILDRRVFVARIGERAVAFLIASPILRPDDWEPIYAITVARRFTPGDLYAIAGAFGGGSAARFVAQALVRAVVQDTARLARAIGARSGEPVDHQRCSASSSSSRSRT